MIIEDIKGNVITNPNLEKGKLEKAYREEQEIYIYFPFSVDEQTAYNVNNQATLDNDKVSCAMYEANKSAITDTAPFSGAFARRIERSEITIEQCPSELKSEIGQKAYPGGVCEIVANAYEGTVTGAGSVRKNSSTVVTVTPANGWRVPNHDELSTNLEITAFDDQGEIEDFFSRYCVYSIVSENAQLTITIPEKCEYVELYVTCLKDEKA